ncbi:MAG TPA: c-type cytochrome [Anaerolineales bacterium]
MKRSEWIARILIIAGTIMVIGAPFYFRGRTPMIHARLAEAGGWSTSVIEAETGQPLHLRLTSDDVMHGFAVGQMQMEPVDVEPGKVTNVSLVFDKPGVYTFYCTRWCGLNHWRMRGTIEVGGPRASPQPVPEPLYVALGIDIDAPHISLVLPASTPSALRGERLAAGLPIEAFMDQKSYRSHSPYQIFEALASTDLTEPEKWDVVSYLWNANTTSESLATGRQLFASNCAACHGENGKGDGVFAEELAKAGESSTQNMAGADAMTAQLPANFTEPGRILGASPALLQGKILRGGMGTGMPMWGSIFTEDQIWNLIAYIYSFQFEYDH